MPGQAQVAAQPRGRGRVAEEVEAQRPGGGALRDRVRRRRRGRGRAPARRSPTRAPSPALESSHGHGHVVALRDRRPRRACPPGSPGRCSGGRRRGGSAGRAGRTARRGARRAPVDALAGAPRPSSASSRNGAGSARSSTTTRARGAGIATRTAPSRPPPRAQAERDLVPRSLPSTSRASDQLALAPGLLGDHALGDLDQALAAGSRRAGRAAVATQHGAPVAARS